MSIRLDPRRLSALKLLAAEAGVRPGELVTSWVEERLDAARAGRPVQAAGVTAAQPGGVTAAQFAELSGRVDRLARQLERMAQAPPASGSIAPATAGETAPSTGDEAAPRRRRGRPPKSAASRTRPAETSGAGSRIPLHEEIAEVIRERGPLTAAEIAAAVVERGRYTAPRSGRPLDAATINSRVSNPAYRALFARSDGRIGLA
jgi:hypothetical protein